MVRINTFKKMNIHKSKCYNTFTQLKPNISPKKDVVKYILSIMQQK